MLTRQLRETILCLKAQGKSLRDISRTLGVSRNSVKKVLDEKSPMPKNHRTSRYEDKRAVIKAIFHEVDGNLVRVEELLKERHQLTLPYSSLTRLVREQGWRTKSPVKGIYYFTPGEEMQHDTSPHKVIIHGKKVTAQCSALICAYSRRVFVRYYPRFTRFEAKLFFHDALTFMGGSCQRCVVDNTSVIIAAGSGADAMIASEMKLLGDIFGFHFIAHAVGDPNRKGRIERTFLYVEKNFLPGRTFMNWQALNEQVHAWCCLTANAKEKRELGMSPESAYLQEKPYLTPLPEHVPPIYEHCQRIVDSQGFVNLDCHRYSVPEALISVPLDVYKHANTIEIYHKEQLVATHERSMDKKFGRSIIKSHHPSIYQRCHRQQACEEETLLRGQYQVLDCYVTQLKKQVRGRGIWQFKRLLRLKRTYPEDAFLSAVNQALHYGLYDLARLESLIIKQAAGEYFNLPIEEDK